jgi:hypothetical protein
MACKNRMNAGQDQKAITKNKGRNLTPCLLSSLFIDGKCPLILRLILFIVLIMAAFGVTLAPLPYSLDPLSVTRGRPPPNPERLRRYYAPTRSNRFLTVVGCHSPPRAVLTPCAFKPSAMRPRVTRCPVAVICALILSSIGLTVAA